MGFVRGIGPMELIIILVIVMIIFGVGRLTEIGSVLGRSIREFRNSVQGDDSTASENESEDGSSKQKVQENSSRIDAPLGAEVGTKRRDAGISRLFFLALGIQVHVWRRATSICQFRQPDAKFVENYYRRGHKCLVYGVKCRRDDRSEDECRHNGPTPLTSEESGCHHANFRQKEYHNRRLKYDAHPKQQRQHQVYIVADSDVRSGNVAAKCE